MEFPCLGIVKEKNEKEIFIAVAEKFEFFYMWEFYTKNYKIIFLAQ